MRRPDEWQPCGRAGGELRPQRWAGMTLWKGQRYGRWLCRCGGRDHVNRLLHFSASTSYARAEQSVPAMHGRSIFGQTLQRRAG